MTLICPKDGMACPDDLCHGSGCMDMNGSPMLEKCPKCGTGVDVEMGEDCLCEDEDDDLMDPMGEV